MADSSAGAPQAKRLAATYETAICTGIASETITMAPINSLNNEQRRERGGEITHRHPEAQHAPLILWGCDDFGNDPRLTAFDFREALENEFYGAFAEIVFAITGWSWERKLLGPFRGVFAAIAD